MELLTDNNTTKDTWVFGAPTTTSASSDCFNNSRTLSGWCLLFYSTVVEYSPTYVASSKPRGDIVPTRRKTWGETVLVLFDTLSRKVWGWGCLASTVRMIAIFLAFHLTAVDTGY